MGEKGQPSTAQSPAIAGNRVSVPMQEGAVPQDSDWGGTGGIAGHTVSVPLQQGGVQQDSDWGGTGGTAGDRVRVPLEQGAVQQDSDWAHQSAAGQSGEKGQTGSDSLANMKLQQELQKESEIQQDLSNISKSMSDAAKGLIGKEGT